MKKRAVLAVSLNSLGAILIAAFVTVGVICEPILTTYFGIVGGTNNGGNEYSTYKTDEEITDARNSISNQIMSEGSVLLKNDNEALPIAKSSKISIFGQHAHEILASGSGSGSIGNPTKSFYEVLTEKGLEVNKTLWDFYLNNGGKSLGNGPALPGGNSVTDWSINECDISKYSDEIKSSYSSYNDAGIVVISRTGGEGGDIAMDMSSYGGEKEEHYLELSKEEKDLLKHVKENFKKVIVLLNTNNPMELGFLNELNIDACLYIGGVGMSGLDGVADIILGNKNPSGRLVDTYVFDNFSSPAVQNFGDFTYTNSPYHYVSYKEGIYVGYRYYETRYADKIMNKGNPGSFDYSNEVVYPFGYGLSYTTFSHSDFKMNYDENSEEFKFSVTVKNTGEKAGKDVIELYYESPFNHDSSKIEKSAIELGGFMKTPMLNPNEEKEVTIKIDKRDLASYDEFNKKTYLLEKGNYNFTVASNAHEAINNILSKDGYEVESKGDVITYKQSEEKEYKNDSNTNKEITNLFDDAKYENMTFLSRKDWSKLDNLKDDKLSISDKFLEQANKKGKEASLNPNINNNAEPIVNAKNNINLVDLVETDYDDPKWEKIVQEIKKSDLQKLFATLGYATMAIDYIGKPRGVDTDGPGGLQSFVGGASALKAFGYPTETILASTWNKELAKEFGKMVGEDALHGGVSGWYAPAMNTHRTPFGGRNFEYYSEDGILAGEIGTNVVLGAQEKGLYTFIKHFALNEQDTNRGPSLHTWASEQTMREIYFKPFEMCVKEGKSLALMTSLNCIGVTANVGNYNLITKLLKEEWGFKGMVITDYLAYDADLMMQSLFAGGDIMLSTYGLFSDKSNATINELQRAAKNVLYAISRSNAMYSLKNGGSVKSGIPVYLIAEISVISVIAVTYDSFLLKKYIKSKKNN